MSDPSTPAFRYHPDPIGTGSARVDDRPCEICGVFRGVIYDGPIYGRQADALCLQCIATGDAANALAVQQRPAEFTDIGLEVPDDVPFAVREEVSQRTPGFRGWQQEHWLYHCGDAAAFVGRVGYDRLAELPDALAMVLRENEEFGWTAEQSRAYAESLTADGDSNAYLFRCLHCRTALAYTDMS